MPQVFEENAETTPADKASQSDALPPLLIGPRDLEDRLRKSDSVSTVHPPPVTALKVA